VDHPAEALELAQIQAPPEVVGPSEGVKGGEAVEHLDAVVRKGFVIQPQRLLSGARGARVRRGSAAVEMWEEERQTAAAASGSGGSGGGGV